MALRFRALIFPFLLVCPVFCAPPGIEVRDPSGAIIPTARVDVFGRTLRVSAPGFAPRTVTLAEGEQSVRVTLEPAPVVTSIDVVVRQAPLESGTAATSTTLEIERTGARTVFDAIDRLVPSAFVTRRGVMGYGIATNGTGGVNIRGIGGSPNTGVLVVVDGRPDFQGLMGHPLPDLYSLSDTASVRITQGPASVLYGSNAMGGAIEIQPSRPEAGFETRLTSSLGSYWTTQNRLHHAANFEKSFYSLNAGYSGTSGDRPSSDFRNPDATAAFGYDLSSHWKTSLQGRYGYFHVEDPGPWTAPLSNSYANVGRGGYDLSFANAYGKSHGSGHVYGAWGRHFITDGFRSTDSTQGARVMQSFLVAPSVTLDAGADFNDYGGMARNIRQGLDYGDHRLREGAGFARAQWNASARLLLTGGFRYHRHSLYGGLPVPEFNATLRLTSRYSFSAGLARGFRNPTIRELYLFPAPNPALQPEKLWNYQATFHARPASSVTAWTTFYYADLSNQVVTLGRFPNLLLANTGSALNRGIEANLQWRPLRAWTLSSGYAWLHSTNLAPLVPVNKLNGSLHWHHKRVTATLSAMSAGRRWSDAGRTRRLGSYTLVTLQSSCQISRAVSVFTMLDNVLNRKYEVLPGYPMPGTNAIGGFSLSF